MKALWIIGALLAVAFLHDSARDPHPLLIDAKADSFCDFPKARGPLPKFKRSPMVNGLDKPNGEIA